MPDPNPAPAPAPAHPGAVSATEPAFEFENNDQTENFNLRTPVLIYSARSRRISEKSATTYMRLETF